MSAPDLSRVGVVVVEYHSGGLTASVAETAAALGCAVAVADNSGTYDGVGIVTAMPGNVGFGAACNAAVRSLPASVEIVVLWNPDAQIESSGLAELVAAVQHSGWDVVAPALHTSTARSAGFSYPSPWREPLVVLRELRPSLRRTKVLGSSGTPDPAGVVEASVNRFGSAALLVVGRAAFERVGGFDERFFLYAEDLDLWHRLRAEGYRCGFIPSVVVTHASAGGSPATAARRTVLRWLGVELFAESNGRRWRGLRRAHRAAARFLPHDDDPVVELVRRRVREGQHPASIQREVRHLVVGEVREATT